MAGVGTGAVIERTLVKRMIRRRLRSLKRSPIGGTPMEDGYRLALVEFEDWLIAQPVRTKRHGGIGRQ